MQYINRLVKEAVYEDNRNYTHQADLDRQVQQKIPDRLGIRKLKMHENVAFDMAPDVIVSRVLNTVARQYKPEEYLLDNVNYFSELKLFNIMLKWYQDNVFSQVYDTQGNVLAEYQDTYSRLVDTLGYDPNGYDFSGITRETILYFLIQNDILSL